jgi:hypothetical protein
VGRDRGRPPLRWTDKVREDLKALEIDPKECVALVRDPLAWNEKLGSLQPKSAYKSATQSAKIACGAPCSFLAKNKTGLALHRKKCPHYSASIGVPIQVHSLPCQHCGMTCKSEGGLKKHQNSCAKARARKQEEEMAKEQGSLCEHCNRTFKNKAGVKIHQRTCIVKARATKKWQIRGR